MFLEVSKVITILEECCLWYIFTAKLHVNAPSEENKSEASLYDSRYEPKYKWHVVLSFSVFTIHSF